MGGLVMVDQVANSEDEAIAWFIRQRDPAFSEWEAFTDWLERDPANSAAFDAVALADDRLGALADAAAVRVAVAPGMAPDRRSEPTRRRRLLGWAAAASVLVAGGLAFQVQQDSTFVIETEAGETRTLTLADGSRIELNGGSTLVLDEEDARFAELRRGEALFTVIHNDREPFTVESGPATVVDLGTVFNIVRTENLTEVSVAEGAVLFNPDEEAVRLEPGRRLRAPDDAREVQVTSVDRGAIGAWTDGTLVYQNATMAEVAADLSRNLGIRVRADAAVAPRPFKGVIQLDRGSPDALAQAAPVLGVEVRRARDEWILTAENGSRD